MVLTTQLRERDTIPVKGRIPGWLHPIGALHRCQCVGYGFTPISEDLASVNKTEAVIAQYDWLLFLK